MPMARAGRQRIAARATARLLGRLDSSAPVVFIDQPLYAGQVHAWHERLLSR